MSINEFNFKYAFILFTDDEMNIKIHFYPTSGYTATGAMNTTFPDGNTLSGEYTLNPMPDGSLVISWINAKFLFVPTELGFNLVNTADGTVTYSFARPVQ